MFLLAAVALMSVPLVLLLVLLLSLLPVLLALLHSARLQVQRSGTTAGAAAPAPLAPPQPRVQKVRTRCTHPLTCGRGRSAVKAYQGDIGTRTTSYARVGLGLFPPGGAK